MKPLFTFNEIREIERRIILEDNFPSSVLMENAGKNSFDCILNNIPDIAERAIYIFCGKGNNAGDGYTLARHFLIAGIDFKIITVEDPSLLKGDALVNYQSLLTCGAGDDLFVSLPEFARKPPAFLKNTRLLIIDAILGTGIAGSLGESYAVAIELINKLRSGLKKSLVVSLDIPSGLMSGKQINPMAKADFTISMGTMKSELFFGEGKENAGKVFVVPIGITDGLILKHSGNPKFIVDCEYVRELYPLRRKTSYKYSNGKVLVIGGSKGLSGAVAMSSLAVIKSGVGAVCAAMPVTVSRLLGRKFYDIMRVELDETSEGSIAGNSFDALKKRLDWAEVVLLGPGISTNTETKQFVYDVVMKSDKNLVIDADALTLIAEEPEILKRRKKSVEVILTPHVGEFSRLSKLDAETILLNRFDVLREFALSYNVNVSLKSETTISCSSKGEIFVNSTGNEALAAAGTGDVLSGIIASVFARSKDAKAAMLCGNYIHGLCADLYSAKKENKQSASPMDILKYVPKAVTCLIKGV